MKSSKIIKHALITRFLRTTKITSLSPIHRTVALEPQIISLLRHIRKDSDQTTFILNGVSSIRRDFIMAGAPSGDSYRIYNDL
jgi:hypothetical protein